MSSSVLYQKKGSVATIVMNSPESMNSLTDELVTGLREAINQAEKDTEIGAVILTGSQKAFCAGGDLKKLGAGFDANGGYDYMKSFHSFVSSLYNLSKPVIAAVNGHAVGAGFCIALLADIIIAADTAKFGMAFSNVGLIPDLAGMYTLPRLVGMQRAKELIYTGKTIFADDAEGMGIVNTVVPYEALIEASEKLAAKLAAGPRLAYKAAKTVLNQSIDLTLDQLLELESQAQSLCFQTEDHKAAVDAFFNKKKPVFQGK